MEEYIEAFCQGEVGKINLRRAIAYCDLDPEFSTNVEYFRRYKFNTQQTVVDGYSGGAIFSLIGNLENFEVVLDGIAVRANKQYVHIIDSNYLANIFTRR